MSDVNGVGAPPPPAPVPNAEAGAASGAAAGGGSANVTIATLDDLKIKARPLYDAMMMAMAKHVIDYQNRSNARIKETLSESQA